MFYLLDIGIEPLRQVSGYGPWNAPCALFPTVSLEEFFLMVSREEVCNVCKYSCLQVPLSCCQGTYCARPHRLISSDTLKIDIRCADVLIEIMRYIHHQLQQQNTPAPNVSEISCMK